ncbi:hypothetical protein EVAR_21016_1 [Eumeta japonica]|uniref:Uncharacterized protein n=1 Tax=Eumeta variegata TaxID=151549 RepID=A0A4C1V1M7_EUMVA|nr:hypothetical protein EVAR_21016_1 [Eumeta japonica]
MEDLVVLCCYVLPRHNTAKRARALEPLSRVADQSVQHFALYFSDATGLRLEDPAAETDARDRNERETSATLSLSNYNMCGLSYFERRILNRKRSEYGFKSFPTNAVTRGTCSYLGTSAFTPGVTNGRTVGRSVRDARLFRSRGREN